MKLARQQKRNNVWYHIYVESEKKKVGLIEAESRMVVNPELEEWGSWGDAGQSYKPTINKLWGSNVQHGDYVNNTTFCDWNLLGG